MSDFTASGRVPVHTDEGYTLAPGETNDRIDPTLPHNARHLVAGTLVRLSDRKPATKGELLEEARKLDIRGRSSMNAEDLQLAIDAAKAPPPPSEEPNTDPNADEADKENEDS